MRAFFLLLIVASPYANAIDCSAPLKATLGKWTRTISARVNPPSFEMRNTGYRNLYRDLATIEYEFRENTGLAVDRVYIAWQDSRLRLAEGELTSVPFNHGGAGIPPRVQKTYVKHDPVWHDMNRQTSFTLREGTVLVRHHRHIQHFPDQAPDFDYLYVVGIPDKLPSSRFFSSREQEINVMGSAYRLLNIARDTNGLVSAKELSENPTRHWLSLLVQFTERAPSAPFDRIFVAGPRTVISNTRSAGHLRKEGREITAELYDWPDAIGRVSVALPTGEPSAAVLEGARRWGACELVTCGPELFSTPASLQR